MKASTFILIAIVLDLLTHDSHAVPMAYKGNDPGLVELSTATHPHHYLGKRQTGGLGIASSTSTEAPMDTSSGKKKKGKKKDHGNHTTTTTTKDKKKEKKKKNGGDKKSGHSQSDDSETQWS